MIEISPSLLAAADQELSDVDACVAELIQEWKDYDWKKKNDRVFKIAEFITELALRDYSGMAVIAMLAATIEKLADEKNPHS